MVAPRRNSQEETPCSLSYSVTVTEKVSLCRGGLAFLIPPAPPCLPPPPPFPAAQVLAACGLEHHSGTFQRKGIVTVEDVLCAGEDDLEGIGLSSQEIKKVREKAQEMAPPVEV